MKEEKYSLIHRVALYVTSLCNLKCKHCYVGEKALGHLCINDIYEPIINCISSIEKPVDITGGEPFMLSNIDDILIDMMNKNVSVTGIFTNATLLPKCKNQVNRIIKHSQLPISWFVSIDGFETSHDCFRGRGAFAMAMEGINLLLENDQTICINTMLHSKVTKKDLKSLHDYIVSNKIKRWRIDTPFMMGNWLDNYNRFGLYYTHYINLLTYAVELWNSSGKCYEIEAGHIFKFLNDSIYFLDYYKLDEPVCPCKTLPIWWNGDVTWCQDLNDSQYLIGNILNNSFDEIYSRYVYYKTRSIRSIASYNSDCINCDLIEWCGCGCRVHALSSFNSEKSKDPIACKLYKRRLYEPVMKALMKNYD